MTINTFGVRLSLGTGQGVAGRVKRGRMGNNGARIGMSGACGITIAAGAEEVLAGRGRRGQRDHTSEKEAPRNRTWPVGRAAHLTIAYLPLNTSLLMIHERLEYAARARPQL